MFLVYKPDTRDVSGIWVFPGSRQYSSKSRNETIYSLTAAEKCANFSSNTRFLDCNNNYYFFVLSLSTLLVNCLISPSSVTKICLKQLSLNTHNTYLLIRMRIRPRHIFFHNTTLGNIVQQWEFSFQIVLSLVHDLALRWRLTILGVYLPCGINEKKI